MKKLNVAVIGYGRSGCNIHSEFFKSDNNDIVNVVAVVELDPAREAAAKADFGCDTYSDYKELFNRTDIDLVVNASYSDMHYPITLDIINHGFNVLCEKPICKKADQLRELIAAAKEKGVMFTIFQQSRLAEYFENMERIMKSGILGDIKLVRGRWNAFSRRYDWQTLIYRDAGSMRNTGPHPFEQCIWLSGTDEMPKNIYSKLEVWNSVGDAEDYVFAVLEYENGPRFEIETNPSDPYNDGWLYRVYGTRGAMRVSSTKIEYQYYLEEESPQPVLDHKSLHDENGNPSYCRDKIEWHKEELELTGDAFAYGTSGYYHRLYDHMVNGGELFIDPAHIIPEIAIFEEIERQNPLVKKFENPFVK
ncbi:MAG: Gfo/Idh/MocA family oxidoreductase [Oscillospiraceae bacterium]|nr:Gfo/Idh/MocA family oxidoreductase [Oscillospiraceae bacterium]